jgi:nitrogen fixation/metabolism regulation signal transduction histidine kinase
VRRNADVRSILVRVIVSTVAVTALLLLVLLAAASANTEFFDRYYSWLYAANIAVALVFLLIVVALVVMILARLRKGKFGTRLLAKLAIFFALVGVLPGAIIYVVSYQFVSRSIESWFDVNVETALTSGLNLGRAMLDASLSDLQTKAHVMAEQLASTPPSNTTLTLLRMRDQFGVQEAMLVESTRSVSGASPDLHVIAQTSGNFASLMPDDLPTPIMLDQARTRGYASIEGEVDGDPRGKGAKGALRLRVVVLVPDTSASLLQPAERFLELTQPVSPTLARNADAVQRAYREYQEKALGRTGLRKMYIGTLTLALFLATFIAMMLAPPTIGASLEHIGVLAEFSAMVRKAFADREAASEGVIDDGGHWQQQVSVSVPGETEPLTLLVRGTRLLAATPAQGGQEEPDTAGYVVVFDDISDVISAQRSAAWGEVARRLAHEIKNPLTPIQLSAERLQMKLADKLSPHDADVLKRGATTIVNQVAAMKQMVDDFRDYARTPPAVLANLQLNDLVTEVLSLYGVGEGKSAIMAELSALPVIRGDATQLRQVIHNLLQNAQDAVAEIASPRVLIETKTVEYGDPDAQGKVRVAVRLAVSDNGPGFPARILTRAFEPYVTTKARGTGLGLAMVKKIVDEHGARIDIRNRVKAGEAIDGAQVSILFLQLADDTAPEQGTGTNGGAASGSTKAIAQTRAA